MSHEASAESKSPTVPVAPRSRLKRIWLAYQTAILLGVMIPLLGLVGWKSYCDILTEYYIWRVCNVMSVFELEVIGGPIRWSDSSYLNPMVCCDVGKGAYYAHEIMRYEMKLAQLGEDTLKYYGRRARKWSIQERRWVAGSLLRYINEYQPFLHPRRRPLQEHFDVIQSFIDIAHELVGNHQEVVEAACRLEICRGNYKKALAIYTPLFDAAKNDRLLRYKLHGGRLDMVGGVLVRRLCETGEYALAEALLRENLACGTEEYVRGAIEETRYLLGKVLLFEGKFGEAWPILAKQFGLWLAPYWRQPNQHLNPVRYIIRWCDDWLDHRPDLRPGPPCAGKMSLSKPRPPEPWHCDYHNQCRFFEERRSYIW